MNKEQAYLLYLIKCAVDNKKVLLPKVEIDWEYLAQYAESHQFEQILYPLLEGSEHKFSTATWKHLEQRYGLSITRNARQELEYSQISDTLSQKRIKHLPLKGGEIKKYYPYSEMRTSMDFDILIYNADREMAVDALSNLGYRVKLEYESENYHDVLEKEDFYIELHKNLLAKRSSAQELSGIVWDYTIPDGDYAFNLKEEFLYVFLLEHLRRHLLKSGGAGIKHITDIYVLNNKVDFDKKLLQELLEKGKLVKLNETVQKLIRKWFYYEEIEDETLAIMENMILNSGVYGNFDTFVKISNSDEKSRNTGYLKRCIQYIFPGMEFMSMKYPILKRKPYLLPVMWIVRMFNANVGVSKEMISSMRKINKSEAEILDKFAQTINE